MKKYICLIALVTLVSCETVIKDPLPLPNDIDLNDLAMPSVFSHVIPADGFKYKEAVFNTAVKEDGSWSGFCYSNQNSRSYCYLSEQTSVDSMKYSVYTAYVNATKVFAVANATDQDAFITFDKPYEVDYLLLANTTQMHLGMTYGGSWYNSNTKPTAMANNPNMPSSKQGIFNAYLPNGSLSQRLNTNGSYFKVIVTGYNGTLETGKVVGYLVCRAGGNPDIPAWNFGMRTDWFPLDLLPLGKVDRLVFNTESSAKVSGEDILPHLFCLDGIRIIR